MKNINKSNAMELVGKEIVNVKNNVIGVVANIVDCKYTVVMGNEEKAYSLSTLIRNWKINENETKEITNEEVENETKETANELNEKMEMRLDVYRVTYSFYEGCTDYIDVIATDVQEASKKAIKKLECICSTDDWDIESIEPFRS